MFTQEKPIHIVATALLIIAVQVIVFAEYFSIPNAQQSLQNNIACTQEAKQCPDGSYVGRIGPDCAFAPCLLVKSIPSCDELNIQQDAIDAVIMAALDTEDYDDVWSDVRQWERLMKRVEVELGCVVEDNIVDVSDWQTYRNEEYGFEFRYPQQWEARLLKDSDNTLDIEFFHKNPNGVEREYFVELSLIAKHFTEEYISDWKERHSSYGSEFIIIGGIPAFVTEDPHTPYLYPEGKIYQFANETTYYYMFAQIWERENLQFYQETLNKILSSFKFIESNVVTNEKECREFYGIWGRFGEFIKERCSMPTSDGGQLCNDSNECEGDCIAQLTEKQKKSIINGQSLITNGYCTSHMFAYFGCHPFVENGTVDEIVCID